MPGELQPGFHVMRIGLLGLFRGRQGHQGAQEVVGQFVGQNTLAQIGQGQIDRPDAHIVKGLQGPVAEKARALARHQLHMVLPHLFAVR